LKQKLSIIKLSQLETILNYALQFRLQNCLWSQANEPLSMVIWIFMALWFSWTKNRRLIFWSI